MTPHRPYAGAALVAAGLGRLVADVLALRSLAERIAPRAGAATPDALRNGIAETLALFARHCIRLGGTLPSGRDEFLPMSAIPPAPPLDPAAAAQALECGLVAFIQDIETVALLAEEAGDAATSRLLRDRHAVFAAWIAHRDDP